MKQLPKKVHVEGYILEANGVFDSMFANRQMALEHKEYLWDAHGREVTLRKADIEWERTSVEH